MTGRLPATQTSGSPPSGRRHTCGTPDDPVTSVVHVGHSPVYLFVRTSVYPTPVHRHRKDTLGRGYVRKSVRWKDTPPPSSTNTLGTILREGVLGPTTDTQTERYNPTIKRPSTPPRTGREPSCVPSPLPQDESRRRHHKTKTGGRVNSGDL